MHYTTREDAIKFYKCLANGYMIENSQINLFTEHLPPYFCRLAVLSPKDLKNIQNISQAYTGDSDCISHNIYTKYGNTSICEGNLQRTLLKSLPLSGYKERKPSPKFLDLLQKAFEFLEKIDQEFLRHLHEFTSLIVLLEKDSNLSDHRSLTSLSLPVLPFCTFITEASLFHIAPDIIFPNNSLYSLAENLYHESIHQELSFKLLSENIFVDGFDPALERKIDIPWRNTQWEIDRALHAAYVYWRLSDMRCSEKLPGLVNKEELQLIRCAYKKGVSNVNYLSTQLHKTDKYFTDLGKAFLCQIRK